MADYGHELAFGTFLTPQNERPQDVVALAQATERAGLDLVTFQDHPYQPAYLDTWTLLSYVAAKTERVALSGNVLNLPLRNPAVLARSAASLDLLSGGRFELGLGAGAFWDAIEAMGRPNRSQGGAVAALSEAIDIIRAIWSPSERRGVFVDGEHYRVHGAKRGPEPAHDIQIWLGALKPRLLRLIGEKADGWLPSYAYLQPGDLGRGNAIIDEAAAAAGRDPRELRRLLNIPPELATVEQLLPLVHEDGIATFILWADDADAIRRFGEVAADLRAAVGPRAQEVVRGPKALTARRDGIDYDAVPPSLARTAVEPGDREYGRVRSTYIRSGSPGLVLRPANADEVVEALAFAREQDAPLAVRSGGHGIVTELELVADEVADVVFSTMIFDATNTAVLLERWGDVVEASPRALTSFLYVFAQRNAGPVARLVNVHAGDGVDAASAALTPLLDLGPLLDAQVQAAPYAAIVPAYDNRHDGGPSEPLISNGADAAVRSAVTRARASPAGSGRGCSRASPSPRRRRSPSRSR